MTVKVRWTEQAYARLAEIHEYIAADNPAAASELVHALVERGDALKDHPRRGRVVPELRSPEIRELVHRNYRLVYRLSAELVQVLTVLEGHRRLRSDELE